MMLRRCGGASHGKFYEMYCHHLHPNRIPLIASAGVDVTSLKNSTTIILSPESC
jgi:hypothetical protein